MTISNFRATEALYLIIVRDRNAEQLLKDWAKSVRVQATVENNRMKLFEQRGLILFQMNWTHSWNNVTIWDYWKRQHIDIN
jgi:hypothetical protein